MNAVITKAGTVHATIEGAAVCGTKAANAVPTEAAPTCKRCAAKAAKAEAPTLFDSVTSPTQELAEVSAEVRAAARAARRDALVAKNWADTKAKAARMRAEELAAERYAMAANAAKLAEAEAKRAEAARVELAAKRAAVAAKAANLAKLAEVRAAKLAADSAKRAEVAKAKRDAEVKAARIRRELDAADRALGGAYVAHIGASMTTTAKAALSEDEAMIEAARHMGRAPQALAESWADAKDEYRVTRAARLAARMAEVGTIRPKAEVQAYRDTLAYRNGAATLAKLGRGVAVVVETRIPNADDAASGWAEDDMANRGHVTIYRPVAVPANLSLTVTRAEATAAKAAKRLAEVSAKADATARKRAAEVSAKAEAKVMAARAEAAKWAEVPTFQGWALIEVATLTKAPTAKQAAKLAAELGARADDTVSHVMKAAKGRVFNDTTARSAFKAANGTVTPEAKRAAVRARVAAFRARKRAEAGTEARAYNATARNAK